MADYNIYDSSGKLRNWFLDSINFYNATGALKPLKEGDFVCTTGGTFSALLRFSNLPLGITPQGSTMAADWYMNDDTLLTNTALGCLGSSTMAGHGLTYPNRYADMIQTRLNANGTGVQPLNNIALDGQTSVPLQPLSQGGTNGRSVDNLLALNPSFILLDEPTNWAAAYDEATQVAYWKAIFNYCFQRGTIVLFNGSRPRTQYTDPTARARLANFNNVVQKDPLLKYVVNVNYNLFLKSGTTADIRSDYDLGDGIHMNATGITALELSTWTFLQKFFKSITAFNQYILERSTDGVTYTTFDTLTAASAITKTYTYQSGYYRAKARLKNNVYTPVSSVVHLTGSTGPTAYRMLVDIGGNGVTTVFTNAVGVGAATASPDTNGNYWNNIAPGSNGLYYGLINGYKFRNLADTQNFPRGIDFTVVHNCYGTFTDSTSTQGLNFSGATAAVGEYPLTAVQDSMFAHNSINAGGGGQIRFDGLDPARTYSFKFWGSRNTGGATDSRFIQIKLSTVPWGDASQVEYNGSNNTTFTQAGTLSGITGLSSVAFDVQVKAGSTFGYINVIDINVT